MLCVIHDQYNGRILQIVRCAHKDSSEIKQEGMEKEDRKMVSKFTFHLKTKQRTVHINKKSKKIRNAVNFGTPPTPSHAISLYPASQICHSLFYFCHLNSPERQ